ncbi:MAG TPA: hypothetical protein VKH63_21255 [Candidatus Acidoferrum sp.]|jgi:hypothetical protein|nr:hypothetical protein [Candidatus Acidoferrum sp.]
MWTPDRLLPLPRSLIAQLTDTGTPARSAPLTKRDATVILSHIYTRLLYAAYEDPQDALAKLSAEQTLLRLRAEIHKDVFGIEV